MPLAQRMRRGGSEAQSYNIITGSEVQSKRRRGISQAFDTLGNFLNEKLNTPGAIYFFLKRLPILDSTNM